MRDPVERLAGTPGGKAPYGVGQWRKNIQAADFLRKNDVFQSKHLANDRWVKNSQETLRDAITGAKAYTVFLKEYLNQDASQYVAITSELEKTKSRLAEAQTQTIAATRMPPSKSSDPALLAIAQKVLSETDWKVGKVHRIVLIEPKKTVTETLSDERVVEKTEGKFLKTWTWTETRDEFRICTAEEALGEIRLVYYTLRYYRVGPKWKPLQKWYASHRNATGLILPENIAK